MSVFHNKEELGIYKDAKGLNKFRDFIKENEINPWIIIGLLDLSPGEMLKSLERQKLNASKACFKLLSLGWIDKRTGTPLNNSYRIKFKDKEITILKLKSYLRIDGVTFEFMEFLVDWLYLNFNLPNDQ